MKKEIKIDNKIINESTPPYIVAEIGLNHNKDLLLAKRMIKEAKENGADAVKFQTYITEELVVKQNPTFKLFKELELSKNEFKEIASYCKEVGITFFSTPFSPVCVNWLEEINVPCYKIASMDIDYYDLLKECAKTGKPLILSTGMSSIKEIEKALEVILKENNENIILLHAISKYPACHNDMNLGMIKKLKELFNCLVGFSDHSVDNLSAIIARVLNAVVFEKHFTLNKKLNGPDHSISLEPKELKELRKVLEEVDSCLKEQEIRSDDHIKKSARRGIYAKRDIKEGEVLNREDITLVRPLEGALSGDFISFFIGKVAKKDIKKDDALQLDLV